MVSLDPGVLTTYLVPAVILAIVGVLWILALMDVLQRSDEEFPGRPGVNIRFMWVTIVLFGSGIGAFVYYLMVMRPYPRRRD